MTIPDTLAKSPSPSLFDRVIIVTTKGFLIAQGEGPLMISELGYVHGKDAWDGFMPVLISRPTK